VSDALPTPPIDGLELLAVDDDPAIRALIEANFTRRGAHVQVAASPEAALERCEARTFDAVVLDLMLPGRSGLDILPEIILRQPGVPVIILTAHGSVDLAVQCLHAGAYTFLQKPFRGAHLVTTVAQAVDAGRTRRKLGAAEDRARHAEDLLKALQRERELEAQLVQHYRMASLGTLAAGVAHEINNPIAFVRANLVSLARHLPTIERTLKRELLEVSSGTSADEIADALEDVRPCVAESLSGVERVLDIVSAVKRSARPADGTRQDNDLAELARAATVLARNRFMGNVKLVQELESAPVRCDGSRVSQAVINLLSNAADVLAGEGGTAWMRTGVEGGQAFLEVADSGKGIAPESMPELFKRFFTTKGPRGTGLGLAISREIVEEHGGSLVVASRVGGGAVFRIELPVQAAGEAVQAIAAEVGLTAAAART
jgi:two-component system NtrC family sensor kinase